MIRGLGGEVVKADQSGITTKLAGGKTESYAWNDLGQKAASQLVLRVIDRASADDSLSAGLLAVVAEDFELAEKLLEQAREQGADIGPYLGSLAAAALVQAQALLAAEKFSEVEATLAALEEKYDGTTWFAGEPEVALAIRPGRGFWLTVPRCVE